MNKIEIFMRSIKQASSEISLKYKVQIITVILVIGLGFWLDSPHWWTRIFIYILWLDIVNRFEDNTNE